MQFSVFAAHLATIQKTTSRLIITQELSSLFQSATPAEVRMISYLLLGTVAPPYEQQLFGIAEKLMIRAIAGAYSREEHTVRAAAKKAGDLGTVAQDFRAESSFLFETGTPPTLAIVFEAFQAIAKSSGTGSQEEKISRIANLLQSAEPESCKYIVRMLLGTLRLGFSAMTMLDAYSWMLSGGKEHRKPIERAYNVRPDVGFIGETVRRDGLEGLTNVTPVVGVPVLMARAERVASPGEILEKMEIAAVEPKYDGFRLQLHYKKGAFVKLFTRSMEDVSHMYPDIIAAAEAEIIAKEVIIEGEAVGFNPTTGEYLPFQETVQRKRKYDVAAMAQSIPLRLFTFDVLFVDGKSYLDEQYIDRRKALKNALLAHSAIILPTPMEEVNDAARIETLFETYVQEGLEGIMAKKLNGRYEAGARGWNWIKFKKSYSQHLNDTVDCVVMGYYSGKGKRTAFGIGAFLVGIYNPTTEQYETVAKIGTGLTDEEWKAIKINADQYATPTKPTEYSVEKSLNPDVWISPAVVVEIRADEITRSPVHTAARQEGNGLALRFPRMERLRPDKQAVDATATHELQRLFELQRK